MNRREANAYVATVLASEVEHHIDNGSDWIERNAGSGAPFDDADRARVVRAVKDAVKNLRRRAAKLTEKKEVERG